MSLIFALVAGVLVLVGIVLFLLGVWRWRVERAFVARANRAQGTVVGFNRRPLRRTHRRSSRHGSIVADFPVVRYMPAGGPEIEFESPIGSSPRAYHEGQAVTILYDPADPQQGTIQAGWRQHLLPLFLLGVGVFLCIFGGLFWLGAWLQR